MNHRRTITTLAAALCLAAPTVGHAATIEELEAQVAQLQADNAGLVAKAKVSWDQAAMADLAYGECMTKLELSEAKRKAFKAELVRTRKQYRDYRTWVIRLIHRLRSL
jgi:hypothetical protein